MELKSKYSIGETVGTKDRKYIGIITELEITAKGLELQVRIIYLVSGNERTVRLSEESLVLLKEVTE